MVCLGQLLKYSTKTRTYIVECENCKHYPRSICIISKKLGENAENLVDKFWHA